MKIIDKKTFGISEIESWKVSEFIQTHYVYTGVELDVNEIPKGFVFAEGTMNIAGVNGKNYDIAECTGIEYMTAAEKQAYYDAIAEQNRIRSFLGKRVKMTVDYDFAIENLNGFVIKCQSDSNIIVLPIEKTEIKDDNGNLTGVTKTSTILMEYVMKSDFDTLTNKGNKPEAIDLIATGIIVVDTIGGESLDFAENGNYKYLIPQPIA